MDIEQLAGFSPVMNADTLKPLFPGDLVCINSLRMRSASITNIPVARESIEQPKSLGYLCDDDLAFIINVDHISEESLVLTTTGILGWIYTAALELVSR